MSVFVILCFIISGSVFASEPQCSRFHYEEQTLEKMIKLEILVKKMKSDLEEDRNQLKLDWQTEKESMKNEFNEMKEQYEAEKNEFNEMKEQNDAERHQHSEDVKKIKDSAVTPTIAFLANDLTDLTPSAGHTFVYKTTNMNEGNGYDNTTGIFTAPVGGTFMFTAQFMLSGGAYLYYAVVSDNNFIKRGHFNNKVSSCHTFDAITVLKSGGRVWVTIPQGSSSLAQHDTYWNTFSGVLLHQ